MFENFLTDWFGCLLAVFLFFPCSWQASRFSARRGAQRPLNLSGSTISYWRQRSRTYGRRAVLNLRYDESDIDRVTDQQVREIFPHVTQRLEGWEKVVLDFGCGPGRFSKALADMVSGRTIAADPILRFLDLAPKATNVDYRLISDSRIPIPPASIDLLWICLVLGGIPHINLKKTIRELDRVLKPGALICLVENTTRRQNLEYWKYRDPLYYRDLFHFAALERVHCYDELGEEISVMVGRKKLPA